MSAGFALQARLVEAAAAIEGLSGVFDGPPARAAFPYLVVDAGTEFDWSHKSGSGREVAVALTLWDDQPARLAELCGRIEMAMTAIADPEGWDVVSIRFSRKRIVRDVAGPWAAALDYRARLLSEAEGASE